MKTQIIGILLLGMLLFGCAKGNDKWDRECNQTKYYLSPNTINDTIQCFSTYNQSKNITTTITYQEVTQQTFTWHAWGHYDSIQKNELGDRNYYEVEDNESEHIAGDISEPKRYTGADAIIQINSDFSILGDDTIFWNCYWQKGDIWFSPLDVHNGTFDLTKRLN